MSFGEHTLGPTCAYHQQEPDKPLPEGSEAPPVRAQFFYVSSLPIDDPLSPVPPISSDKTTKHPPQPFSVRDNAALEEAWHGFQIAQHPKNHASARPSSRPKSRHMFSFPKFAEAAAKSPSPPPVLHQPRPSKARPESTNASHIEEQYNKLPKRPESTTTSKDDGKPTKDSQPGVLAKHATELANTLGKAQPTTEPASDASDSAAPTTTVKESEVLLTQTPPVAEHDAKPVTAQELADADADADHSIHLSSPPKSKRRFSPFRHRTKASAGVEGSSSRASTPASGEKPEQSQQATSSHMSGRPFARAPSKRNLGSAKHDPSPYQDTAGRMLDGTDDMATFSDESEDDGVPSRGRIKETQKSTKKGNQTDIPKVFVPVGVSRLHLVKMPDMKMKPIYWSPINDTSRVLRATWFYKDTMLPLPNDLANALEVGYEDIKPYQDSYQDELQACIDNGASAETKVVHKLWSDPKPSRPGSVTERKLEDSVEFSGFDTHLPAMQANRAFDPNPPEEKRLFETHSVIFIDRKNAQILRPSLLPNARQNRRPLNSIRKGRQIGIAVVRGFDRKEYQRIHPDTKLDEMSANAKVGAYMSQSGDAATKGRRKSCVTCEEDSKTPNVSDLVLVIHGIGQKLSERVDSFHFTHAINDVRRQFNVELASEAVKGNLKPETGMMVLPVNWRLTVSFDDENKSKSGEGKEANFGLQDITPTTLPAVRSIISDVMLDIPYYLSHHKEKMTSAVIREANRVYRLWCRNNPGFQENGRVHLIAHSLGSVMAMEILGKQPTRVPDHLHLDDGKPSEKIFEFDTTNLFTCGSPSGFFLLLNNAHLIPRKGRNKPGMEGEDQRSGIAGDEGYGCLSLDNLYNILDRNDPISYLVNAAVDKDYADSLQPANIPIATASFWSRMGGTLGLGSGLTVGSYAAKATSERPQMQSMPSTVEMETHDFTREEVAEKRMFLLNENGQIDYFLPASGGPLEIQYLSMLSAHSSYWLSQDYIRFLVTEIGRKPGKANTLPALRAAKKREYKRGIIA